jgi:3-hydroxybutyryl-CoA dehydratase
VKPPAIGATASITKTIGNAEIAAFAAVSGDVNPMHLSADFARRTRFRRPIAHGMLTASLISAVIGTKLPGPGSIWVSQTLNFLLPVFSGDAITASATVTAVREDRPLVTLQTRCMNQDGRLVLDGEALILLDDLADPQA